MNIYIKFSLHNNSVSEVLLLALCFNKEQVAQGIKHSRMHSQTVVKTGFVRNVLSPSPCDCEET